MARNRSSRAVWALLGWSVLIVVGSLWKGGRESGDGALDEAALEQRIATLEEQARVLEEQAALVKTLRGALTVYVPVAGLLESQDLDPRRRSRILNLGRDDGITVGLGVVASTGLVGRVVSVGARASWVTLADDPSGYVIADAV